jgi:diaminopimelate decarboxylase
MTIEFAHHAPHPWFDVAGDCLVIGGRRITEIADQVGRTPFYAYDRQVVATKIAQTRRELPASVHLHYAMKANPMPALVRHVLEHVDGLDVASAAEMQVALDAGADPRTISFAGPGKTANELARAAAAGITINIESERELRILTDIGESTGRPPKVAVRVNPDFELKASGMKMSGGPKQFGVDAERVPDVLRAIGRAKLEFRGFHIFSGSQNLRAEALIDAQQKTAALALSLSEHAPSPVRLLNLGGGFGVPYFPNERPLDLGAVGTALRDVVADLERGLPDAELVIELGRYLVAESGLYVCSVLDRKISRGQVFLVTDGGLHHHLAASGNFGQVIRKNYPVVVANKVRGEAREVATVVGPLCTPLDLLADRADLACAVEGDLIAVLQSGAYGYTASPTRFLSHPEPAEVLV